MSKINWTEDQLIEVLLLYCKLPFGKLHSRNPQVMQLAEKIGRSPNSVALKLVNFASLDPTIDRKGMGNVSALDRATWTKFFDNIDFYLQAEVGNHDGLSEGTQTPYSFESADVQKLGNIRVGQYRFRRMILTSYGYRCAITDVANSNLLVASHIAPWATRMDRRLDPRNGICLNALMDRAFDRGLISISDDCSVLYSSNLGENDIEKLRKNGSTLRLPDRFLPDPDLLHEHRQRFGFC